MPVKSHLLLLHRLTAQVASETTLPTPDLRPPRHCARAGMITLPSLALAIVGPTISGTKAAAFPPNNDASARPGDTINYTISIVNTAGAGVTDATGVQVADTIDANSTFVNSSGKVSPNDLAQ